MIQQKKAVDALQTRYLIILGIIAAAFVFTYVAYLMGFLNYFHAWLMRGLVVAYLVIAVVFIVRYYREKAAISRSTAPRKR